MNLYNLRIKKPRRVSKKETGDDLPSTPMTMAALSKPPAHSPSRLTCDDGVELDVLKGANTLPANIPARWIFLAQKHRTRKCAAIPVTNYKQP